MAHEIDMSNDRANMAYVGDKPWHGLGNSLTDGAPLEVWQKEAGMDWAVAESELIYRHPEAGDLVFPDRRVLYRDDTNAALGVVSDDYNIVHPKQIIEFFRDLTEAHGFKMETAGCLFGGRKFWALAKAGESFTLMGEDEVKPYLLLATSCDSSMSTCAHFTSVRVVCNNTLRMSIGTNGKGAQIKVPHMAQFDADSVKGQLGIVTKAWELFIDNANILANLKLDRETAIQVVADELKARVAKADGTLMTQDEVLENNRVLRRVIELYDGASKGNSFKSSHGTAWGLVNAVTEYFDHETGLNRVERSRAFERAHLTDRASLKVKVADTLLKLAA